MSRPGKLVTSVSQAVSGLGDMRVPSACLVRLVWAGLSASYEQTGALPSALPRFITATISMTTIATLAPTWNPSHVLLLWSTPTVSLTLQLGKWWLRDLRNRPRITQMGLSEPRASVLIPAFLLTVSPSQGPVVQLQERPRLHPTPTSHSSPHHDDSPLQHPCPRGSRTGGHVVLGLGRGLLP